MPTPQTIADAVMPRRMSLTLALTLIAAAVIAFTGSQAVASSAVHDPDVTKRIAEIGRDHNRAMEHLAHLCDEIGPRPAGSRNHQDACEWACQRLKDFGLSNVHLEQCGEAPAHHDGNWAEGLVDRLARTLKLRKGRTGKKLVPVYNVVADIPGVEKPDEYVIVGAHFDSVPVGTGALDNGTGVAAVMEAARMLAEAGVRPQRTIRFILLAGEESGLVGSRGYIEAHPELLPKISAMYNMDHGTNYISGVSVTEPLKDDMDAIFAPVKALDPEKPFNVELVDWLLKGDPNCCQQGGQMLSLGEEGGPAVMAYVYKRQPDGTLKPVEPGSGEIENLGGAGVSSEGDSLVRRMVVSGGCVPGCGDGQPLKMEDLEAMGLLPEGAEIDGAETKVKMVKIGSSDQSVFLAAGIPGFWWAQDGDSSVRYPCHSANDTYDKAIPEYVEHSATVIALGALGTANLGHMLSREKLTKPESEAGEDIPAAENQPKEVRTPRSGCCP